MQEFQDKSRLFLQVMLTISLPTMTIETNLSSLPVNSHSYIEPIKLTTLFMQVLVSVQLIQSNALANTFAAK